MASKLQEIKRALIDIAQKEDVKPFQVTRSQIRKHLYSRIERGLKQHGGLEAVKKELFPGASFPVHPLAAKDIEKKDLSMRTQLIADTIQSCADHLGYQPCEVTWPEFATHIRRKWGKDNLETVRCTITRAGGFYAIRNTYFPLLPTKSVVERKRIKDHSRLNQQIGAIYAEQKFIMESAEEFASRVFSGRVKAHVYDKAKNPVSRILNVTLSDLHIGSDVKKSETGRYDFGKLEESRRLAHVVKEVCDYKIHYRSETKLRVLLIGDVIENLLHSAQDGAILSEQFARALHLLSQAIAKFSSAFPEVEVICLTGNHGRITSKHPKRAVHEKFDSIETMIYTAIKYAVKDCTNVTFTMPQTPYYIYDNFGSKIFCSHGDGVFEVGNAGKSIPVSQLESRANAINAAYAQSGEGVMSLFVFGHIHRFNIIGLDAGSSIITNSALVPPNSFGVSLGIFESQCGQVLFESVAGFPLGDSRLIRVGVKQDKDESLDQYIQPWSEG